MPSAAAGVLGTSMEHATVVESNEVTGFEREGDRVVGVGEQFTERDVGAIEVCGSLTGVDGLHAPVVDADAVDLAAGVEENEWNLCTK